MSIKPFWPHQSYLTLVFLGGLGALSVGESDIKVTAIIVLRSVCTITLSIIYPCVIELGMPMSHLYHFVIVTCSIPHYTVNYILVVLAVSSMFLVLIHLLLYYDLFFPGASWTCLSVSLVCKIPSSILCFPEFPEWVCIVGVF